MPPDLAKLKVMRKKASSASRERYDSRMMAAKVSPAATKNWTNADPGDSASSMEAMLLHLGRTLTCSVQKAHKRP